MKAAAGIAFVDGDRSYVLLAKRSRSVSHPGKWAIPGGRIEDGETEFQAALREVEEELGLPRTEVARRCEFLGYVEAEGSTPFTTFVAFIDPDWLAERLHLDTSENTELLWFDLADFPAGKPLHYGVISIWASIVEMVEDETGIALTRG